MNEIYYITNGETSTGIVLNQDDVMIVYEGGSASNTTVNYEGELNVWEGGKVELTTLNYDGNMFVSNGGTATDTGIKDGGWMEVQMGGKAAKITVNSNGRLNVSSGGTATDITAEAGARLDFAVAPDTYAKGTYNGSAFEIKGGVVSGYTIYPYCELEVVNGGKADKITVNSDGSLYVSSGGTATDITAEAGAWLDFAVAPDTYAKGTYDGSAFEIKDGVVAGYTIYQYCGLNVFDGGTANSTTVTDCGSMTLSGGTANSTMVGYNGIIVMYGGTLNSTTVTDGGVTAIYGGGTAVDTTVNKGGEMYIDGGTANSTTVNGIMDTYGTVNSTTVTDGGRMTIHAGTATDTTVTDGGSMTLSGGTATNTMVNKDGSLIVESDGMLTGAMYFKKGAHVTAEEGAIVNFDLTQTAAGKVALVNDLSAIKGTPKYTLTVDGTQENGLYSLAGGAADFNQTLHVIASSGTELGTLTVDGGTKTIGGGKYTLIRDEDELSLLVGDPLPPEPDNDDLVCKDKSANTKVTGSYGTHLSAAGDEIRLDQIGSVEETIEDEKGVKHTFYNHVEKKVDEKIDTIDYAKIVIDHGAKLSFHAEASAAATFTVYSLTKNRKGQYKAPKKLLTLKLTDKDKDGLFTADSKKLLQLQASGEYYVSMQYADKRKTVTDAYYNVWLNDNSEFEPYTRGDNTDDWGDMKTAGWDGAVASLGTVDAARLEADKTIIKDEWIGFGDKVDCKKFMLADAAQLDFSFNTPGGFVKFTICKLKETEKRDGSKTYSQVTVKTVTATARKPVVTIDDLRLEAGDYFIKLESTNIQKCTGYDVQVTDSEFYTDGDGGWNDALLNKKALAENAQYFYDNTLVDKGKVFFDKVGDCKTSKTAASYTFEAKSYGGFVGFGDETDFAKLTVTKTVDVTFSLLATNDATLEVIQVTKKGEDKYTKKSLQTIKYKQGSEDPAESKKAVTLEARDGVSYYVSVKATNIRKTSVDPKTYYNVTYAVDSHEGAALTMPETSDALAMTDALNFGNYAADTLADASASTLAELDSISGWQNISILG